MIHGPRPSRWPRPVPRTAAARTAGRKLIWWLSPDRLILSFVLPILTLTLAASYGSIQRFGALNFLTVGVIVLALLSLIALAVGSWFGSEVAKLHPAPPRALSLRRVEKVLAILLAISLVAHLVILAAYASHLNLIAATISGQRGAASQLQRAAGRIPGVTTFTQLYLIAFPLFSSYAYLFNRRPPLWMSRLVAGVFVCVLVRSFFGSERLALVESALCLIIPHIGFASLRPRARAAAVYAPMVGLVGLLLLFAVGEYYRTWTWYKTGYGYSNFAEFIYYRGLAYLSTATNNAAGVLETQGAIGFPVFTATWYYRLPAYFHLPRPAGSDVMAVFFKQFGNAEFNNPSGILSPILDFGAAGLAVSLAMGFCAGFLKQRFVQRNLLGLLLFPSWFIGILWINQIFYWADPRYILVYAATPFVMFYLVPPGHRGTAAASGRAEPAGVDSRYWRLARRV